MLALLTGNLSSTMFGVGALSRPAWSVRAAPSLWATAECRGAFLVPNNAQVLSV